MKLVKINLQLFQTIDLSEIENADVLELAVEYFKDIEVYFDFDNLSEVEVHNKKETYEMGEYIDNKNIHRREIIYHLEFKTPDIEKFVEILTDEGALDEDTKEFEAYYFYSLGINGADSIVIMLDELEELGTKYSDDLDLQFSETHVQGSFEVLD